jgi:hypothetical protein
METWIRLAIFALILFSFLRRISKARTRTNVPSPKTQTPEMQSRIPPTKFSRPRGGRKNDFRDVPPPPENPELG